MKNVSLILEKGGRHSETGNHIGLLVFQLPYRFLPTDRSAFEDRTNITSSQQTSDVYKLDNHPGAPAVHT